MTGLPIELPVSAPDTFEQSRRGLIASLVIVSLLLLASVVALFFVIAQRQQTEINAARANSLWSAYQFDSETARLQMALLKASPGGPIDEVALRYDIVLGRASILATGDFPIHTANMAGVSELVAQSTALIRSLEPAIASLGRSASAADLASLTDRVAAARQLTVAMTMKVHQLENQNKIAARDRMSMLHVILACVVGGMTVSISAIIILLVQQMRRMAESHRRLAASQRQVVQQALELRERDDRERRLRHEAELTRGVNAANGQLQVYLTQLTGRIGEITRQCEQMNAVAVQARKGSEQAAASTTRAFEHVTGVADSAEAMALAGRDIAAETSQAVRSARTVNVQAATTGAAIASLTEATEAIDNIVTLIKQVAERTNLLALNATIEAARAGHAGRGFAVVAAEIKGLSRQTETATAEIRLQIEEIQQASRACRAAVGDIRQRIDGMSQISDRVFGLVDAQGQSADTVAGHIRVTAEEAAAASVAALAVRDAVLSAEAHAADVLRLARDLNDQGQQICAEIGRTGLTAAA
jgi:methyl-accepting chemotaxis protein